MASTLNPCSYSSRESCRFDIRFLTVIPPLPPIILPYYSKKLFAWQGGGVGSLRSELHGGRAQTRCGGSGRQRARPCGSERVAARFPEDRGGRRSSPGDDRPMLGSTRLSPGAGTEDGP